MPAPLLQNSSLYEILFHSQPNYSLLRVFGCACWPNLQPYNSHKLQPCSARCLFLGYSLRHKGYRCLHLESGRLYISRYVVFEETIFPFQTTSPSPQNPPSNNFLLQPIHSFPSPHLAPPTPTNKHCLFTTKHYKAPHNLFGSKY